MRLIVGENAFIVKRIRFNRMRFYMGMDVNLALTQCLKIFSETRMPYPITP
jgi:hypothetical protein